MIPARTALFCCFCFVLATGGFGFDARAELIRAAQEEEEPVPADEAAEGEPAPPDAADAADAADAPEGDTPSAEGEAPALLESPLGDRPLGATHPERPKVEEVFTGRGRLIGTGHWVYPGWGGWWTSTTVPYKYALYPPPVALEPRVGLQYNYPYAWQAGIQMPIDGDPHMLPDFPPYVGFVGQLKHLVAAMEAEEARDGTRDGVPPGVVEASALARAGEFRGAGRILARAFRDTSDPLYPFLLTEVFFALEKFDLAELNLRHALKTDGTIARLPAHVRDGVADRFPSREDFAERLATLGRERPDSLLYAYMLLHSDDPASGLRRLAALLEKQPDDRTLSALYRGYLERAF